MNQINELRNFMKSAFGDDKEDNFPSDQELNKPQPPLQKPYDEKAVIVKLPKINEKVLKQINILDMFSNRKSNRNYTGQSISLDELSFLLWATQGVKSIKGDNYATIRTVPSAGARHPFETYIAVNQVEGLKSGIYRYLPINHELILLFEAENIDQKLVDLSLGQKFVKKSAVTFIWSAIPYRGEWRYREMAHKPMLLDAGHICQNLYLACEAIGCGTCAIAAYNQKEYDKFLMLDGENEYVVYLAPVGKTEQ